MQGGDLMEKLKKLRADRDPLYCALADHIVDTDDRTPNHVAQSIQKTLNLSA
ncbi:MAG: shikimate kinase [Granulosicoccaceae bacterium]